MFGLTKIPTEVRKFPKGKEMLLGDIPKSLPSTGMGDIEPYEDKDPRKVAPTINVNFDDIEIEFGKGRKS